MPIPHRLTHLTNRRSTAVCASLAAALCLFLVACATPVPTGKGTPSNAASPPGSSASNLRKSLAISKPKENAGEHGRDANSARAIYFAHDSSELPSSARRQLQLVATQFKSGGRKPLTLIGHTSELGSPEFSIALAQRRVEAVANELERLGVPARHIRRISYGSEAEDRNCSAASCEHLDRRVDIVLGE